MNVVSLPLGELGANLPRPVKQRFTPLRLGIANIWQYDYQEWWLEGGNMLLRGDNTVGKTKVIELTLPFLLDAQMHANRLDPFGQREGRSMHWNLLEGGDLGQQQREGFTWIEFGRLDEQGGERFITIGAWLRASSASTKVDASYFVTERRVACDLFFPRAGEPTIGREGLRRQVGDNAVYANRRDYQRAVDQALFGLGLDRYREMVELLLQLRQPKLSATLKPSKLTAILGDSLPPVDEDQIASLAGQYEQLEQYQAHIEQLDRNEKAVDSYLRSYRTYVRRQVRRAAEELRSANHLVQDEAGKLDAEARTMKLAEEARQGLEAEQTHSRSEKEAVSGRLDAARQSPEMKTVQQLEQARSEAVRTRDALQEAEAGLELAQADVRNADEDLRRAKADLRPAQDRLDRDQRSAEKLAAAADLEELHNRSCATLLQSPDATLKKLRALAATKRDQVEELQARLEQMSPLEASLATVKDQIGNQDVAVEQALEASAAAETAAEEAAETHLQAISAWRGALAELALDPKESELLSENALDLQFEPSVLVSTARQRTGSELEAGVAALRAAIGQLEEQITALDRQIAELELETEIPPAAPAVRTADRTGRPGAPFYRCVEFSSSPSEEQAAMLEAALEGSGILDAWIWADGRIDSEEFDTSLLAGEPVPEPVSQYLRPASGAIAVELVERLLGSLGTAPSAPNYVACDGRWRLGALEGRAYKSSADFVGASAREQARLRKLAELRGERQRLDENLAGRREGLSALRGRQRRLAEEVAAYPSRSQYRDAHRQLERASARLEAAKLLLRDLQEQGGRLSTRLQAARATFNARAAELSLTGHVDRLPQLLAAINHYLERSLSLAWAASDLLSRRGAVEKAAGVLQLHQSRHQQELERVERRRLDHARVQAHVAELERSAAGIAALDALARVEALKAELRGLEAAIEARAQKLRDLDMSIAEASGRLQVLVEKHKESTERRAKAAEQVELLAKRGAIDLALNLELAVDGDWSMSRALDLARHQIEPALQKEPIHAEAINNAQSNLISAFTDLTRSLYGYAPALDWPDGIPRTVATYNQVSVDIRVLRQRLREEIENQRRLLTEKEKDIFEHFLMADLANHLRERILRARRQVQDINENLRAHPTTSGMTLSLRLTEEVENSDEKLALEYLMKDPSLLRDHERGLLRDFFRGRIAAARVQEGAQTWREHLTEALDYRHWHRLGIHQHLDGKSTPFTDARYAAGSGGEKSVSIHQPLFAAAATYYDSSSTGWAPRLIVLDEAFAGIDFPTRGRCLEMGEQFDLDLVMTSYEEMGTHEELPALAIYQMVRDPSRRGVYCERWVWNGHQLRLAQEG